MRNTYVIIATVLFFVLLTVSTAASYYRFIVQHDYVSTIDTDCDPESESCFVWVCDPEIENEGVCTGNQDDDLWHYKVVKRNSADIIVCQNATDDCYPDECLDLDEACEIITCDQNTVELYGYESYCTDPATFAWE